MANALPVRTHGLIHRSEIIYFCVHLFITPSGELLLAPWGKDAISICREVLLKAVGIGSSALWLLFHVSELPSVKYTMEYQSRCSWVNLPSRKKCHCIRHITLNVTKPNFIVLVIIFPNTLKSSTFLAFNYLSLLSI